jgi:catechol 2,3-dioxygenase
MVRVARSDEKLVPAGISTSSAALQKTRIAAMTISSAALAPYSIPAGADIGHVHLKVADLERALAFYRDVLGFDLVTRYGSQAAFVSAGGYHHHIGLNTWESRGGTPPPPRHTGLYHVAIRYPTRPALAAAVRRVLDAGIRPQGASDHGVSEAVYLADPDDNGIELYWDRPREQWPRTPEGEIAMRTDPLDLAALLRDAPAASQGLS